MAATLQTENAVLASRIAAESPGALPTYDAGSGVWTVSHSDKLIVTMGAAQQAGYSASYPQLGWESDIRGLVTSGVIVMHTHSAMIIEDTGTEAAYLESTQPTRAESQEDPPLTWRRRLAEYGVI